MTPLKRARKNRGWRLIDVVGQVRRAGGGLETGGLSRIERNQQTASPALAAQLCRIFDDEINELQVLFPERYMSEAAPMQPHLISNTGAQEAAHHRTQSRADMAEVALALQQKLILNEVQQGEPATCNAYASHCAGALDSDLAYALCLARIHKDAGLLQQALADLDIHLLLELNEFSEQEARRRIADLQAHAQAHAEASYELDQEARRA